MLVGAGPVPAAQRTATRLTVVVVDSLSRQPVAGAAVRVAPAQDTSPPFTAHTGSSGRIGADLAPGAWSLQVRHGAYHDTRRGVDLGTVDTVLTVRLQPILYRMPERVAVAVAVPSPPGVTAVGPVELERLPAPAPDPLRLLRVLPGVAGGGDQAASDYRVRGGSRDENAVVIEGIELIPPQLLRSGLADVLSPINGDLVEEVRFHGGVPAARLDDRLSSVLEVDCRRPDSLEIGAVGSLHRQAAQVGARSGRTRWLGGVRRVDLSRLTHGLQVDGDFNPEYRDAQGLLAWQGATGTDLDLFALSARSRFALAPQDRTLRYDCSFGPSEPPRGPCSQFAGAAAGSERFSDNLDAVGLQLGQRLGAARLTASASGVWRLERESGDPSYVADWFPRVSDPRPVSPDWLRQRQVAAGRLRQRQLDAGVGLAPSAGAAWEMGAGVRQTRMRGSRARADSLWLGQLLLPPEALQQSLARTPVDLHAHLRRSWDRGPWRADLEARGTHFGVPDEWLVLPRLRLGRRVGDGRLTAALGLTAQPPTGDQLLASDTDPAAQKDAAGTLEWEHQTARARWRITLFHRRGWDRMSYTLDDADVRYSGRTDSRTRASGAEISLRGQVARAVGTVSYSWLRARQDLAGDGRGWLPAPTDQRHTATAYLEDRMQLRRGWMQASRFHIRVLYGSGFPYTPLVPVTKAEGAIVDLEEGARYRQRADAYLRFDIGMTQTFEIGGLELDLRQEVANLYDEFNAVGVRQLPDPDGNMVPLPIGLGRRVYNLELRLRL